MVFLFVCDFSFLLSWKDIKRDQPSVQFDKIFVVDSMLFSTSLYPQMLPATGFTLCILARRGGGRGKG